VGGSSWPNEVPHNKDAGVGNRDMGIRCTFSKGAKVPGKIDPELKGVYFVLPAFSLL
jgi:hypothetical protein